MNLREWRGLEIANWHELTHFSEDGTTYWRVPAQRCSKETHYVVYHDPQSCTCLDFKLRQTLEGLDKWCQHLWAVHVIMSREYPEAWEDFGDLLYPVPAGWPLSEHDSHLDPLPLPSKVSGKWTAKCQYEADTYLKRHFTRLLYELCRPVPMLRMGRQGGRPSIRLQDQVFICVFKVFEKEVTQDIKNKLEAMEEAGYIERVPKLSTLQSIMGRPEITLALESLIWTTAWEFRKIDRHFAADSTQFRTPRKLPGGRGVKLHITCGLRSKVVTAGIVTTRDVNDSKPFPSLVHHTRSKEFDVRSIAADAQYPNAENCELIEQIGAIPYLDFPADTTGDVGGAFQRWFEIHRKANPDRFETAYKRRKTVESVNRMIKAKYGARTHFRTVESVRNEVLCKVVCHNIRRVVHGVLRYGIKPVFWPVKNM